MSISKSTNPLRPNRPSMSPSRASDPEDPDRMRYSYSAVGSSKIQKSRFAGCLNWLNKIGYAISNFFQRLHRAAVKQRKLYRKEGCYTVADYDPDDTDAIKSANLPIIWILTPPGSPTTALFSSIADSYNWYFLNIGALLQQEIVMEIKQEDVVSHLMHRGVALPRAFIFEVIRRQMANICRKGQHKGFLFAEYPATFSQCRDFANYITTPDFILYMKFSEKTAQDNLCLYLRFQVRASKILRRLQPEIFVIAAEQFKKFKHEIQHIHAKFGEKFKLINALQSVEDVCKDIMKWVERAAVMHSIIPPLFVKAPLPDGALL